MNRRGFIASGAAAVAVAGLPVAATAKPRRYRYGMRLYYDHALGKFRWVWVYSDHPARWRINPDIRAQIDGRSAAMVAA